MGSTACTSSPHTKSARPEEELWEPATGGTLLLCFQILTSVFLGMLEKTYGSMGSNSDAQESNSSRQVSPRWFGLIVVTWKFLCWLNLCRFRVTCRTRTSSRMAGRTLVFLAGRDGYEWARTGWAGSGRQGRSQNCWLVKYYLFDYGNIFESVYLLKFLALVERWFGVVGVVLQTAKLWELGVYIYI